MKSMYACHAVSAACRPAETRRRRGTIGSLHRSILVGQICPMVVKGLSDCVTAMFLKDQCEDPKGSSPTLRIWLSSSKNTSWATTCMPNCRWHATNGSHNDQSHPKCCYKATELHWSHPSLVQFEKAPAKSIRDRADLVRIEDESEEDRRSWYQPLHRTRHHQAGQCCSWSWCVLGQRAIHGTPCQHRRSCMLFSSSPTQIHTANPRCRCHVGSGIGFCNDQNGLLQLHSGSTASVDNWSTAACPECCRQTHNWHRNSRSHHSCSPESARAPSQVSHHIQTMRAHASGAYRPCPGLPECPTWLRRPPFCPVEEDSDLRTLSDMNFHYWSASSAREASPMPDRKLGTMFLLFSKNSPILLLSKSNWRLIYLHLHTLPPVHNFVEAPLVTLDVNGVWNDDNVM